MKKIVFLLALITLLCASCSSSKASIEGKKMEKSEQQKLAEAKPAVRAWGEATPFNQSFAKTYAEGQARAEFARKLATLVQTASRQATDGADLAHSDGEYSSQGHDQGITSNAFAQQVADGLVSGLTVISTDTYKLKDGQYHVFVCMEWQGSVDKLASEMTKNYRQRVEQQVSDEDRAKMEVRYEEFRKSIEEQLKRLQGN